MSVPIKKLPLKKLPPNAKGQARYRFVVDVGAHSSTGLREGRVRGGKAGTGLGVASVEMSLARLKEALDRAVTLRLVEVNVARQVTIPRNLRRAERWTKAMVPPWNLAEVRAFVYAVKDDRLRAAFLWAYG